MLPMPVAIAVVAASLTFFCWNNLVTLRRAFARRLAFFTVVLRWLVGVACLLVIGLLNLPLVAVVALAILVVVVALVPYRWTLAATGGREPVWEMRELMGPLIELQNRPLRHQRDEQSQAKEITKASCAASNPSVDRRHGRVV